MKIVSRLFLALSFALLSTTAFAQSSTTGSIEGRVVDVNGAAVPGVGVSVKSPNLISPQSATTDDQGNYRVLSLPPGKYTVVIEATKGFARFEQTVDVNLSKTSALDVLLQAANVGATVTVTESASAGIDATANTSGSNISTEQFSNFPTQRTVQSLYSIAPTVARSGLRDASGRDRDPSVAGSSGPENNYILDGVNTTDPAFGGSGANLPFEFVQEVEIKTGAYGAEYGKSTGGIFNVITKSGGNEVHGDGFGYFSMKGLVRGTNQFPFTGSAPNGFSEIDAGIDVGGPIKKDKLWFFGAFNPQQRKNFFLTQQFHATVNNQINTPFYSGKATWAINQKNTFTFSTFGDFTKQQGFLFGGSGFGVDPNSFRGEILTGGHNYAARVNSTIGSNMTGEFAFGLHFQRANTTPQIATTSGVTDQFALITPAGTVVTPTETTATTSQTVTIGGVPTVVSLGQVAFVQGPAGSTLQRNFVRQGFTGLQSIQKRDRQEFSARLQNIWGRHTFKYGFEWNNNKYDINTTSTGAQQTFATQGLTLSGGTGNNIANGFRITNSFVVCVPRVLSGVNTAVCASSSGTSRLAAAIAAGQGPTGIVAAVTANGSAVPLLTAAELNTNAILVRSSTRVRDFENVAQTSTRLEGFYIQDDFKITKNVQINAGLRWDYQQAYGNDGETYLKLNNFKDNLQPRLGLSWDFTGTGKGKVFVNFARFLETPLPLDVNVRAGSQHSQTDKNFNVSRINAPAGSFIVPGVRADTSVGAVNLGATPTPIDPGLKPQTVNEATAGFAYEISKGFVIGTRGIYRNQAQVIEDGSFDDGDNYFLFNPGRRGNGETTEDKACGNLSIGCFGHARRYYRALEITATKRFSNNYQFIASYVFSSLTGNYEGLFRNDNGQADPNITSLFDLVSLLKGTYGHLPNDRPHQLKFDGSYRTPWKLLIGASFRAQSGIPYNQLIPHQVYGNNEGFGVPRGTAIVPTVGVTQAGFPNVVNSIGSNRTPTTFNLDMNAYYPVKLGEKKELRFQADWFNVINNQRAIRLDETYTVTSTVAGVPPVNNPFYGAGTIFQFPSSLRLGVKFTF